MIGTGTAHVLPDCPHLELQLEPRSAMEVEDIGDRDSPKHRKPGRQHEPGFIGKPR
jgi:hypothetical protein